MAELEPTITTRARLSPLWIIPAVALVAGIWMVVQAYLAEGPTVMIEFRTAEGLEEGKTKIKMLDVEVGIVEEVRLKEDVSGIIATVALDKEVTNLLRDDTKFWVVRARVGVGGVSGIGTLLSGAYIELAPGTGSSGKRRFVGLERPPLTPVGAPGKRLRLVSERATINAGDSILYQGFKVGRVEHMQFDADRRLASYDIFIDAPYDQLVHDNTRFWDVSGIALDASAEGVRLQLGAIDTLLLGGVAFGSPPGLPRGDDAAEGAEFKLYESYSEILKNPYRYGRFYVVAFEEDMGGLLAGAPVTFRGIQIGRVERILLRELTAEGLQAAGGGIPVLIYLEPGRLEVPDAPQSVEDLARAIASGVPQGLRATMRTGNLITGRKLITFDYYPDAPEAELSEFDQWVQIPTHDAGFGQIADQVSALLRKLNALPVEQTVASANTALDNAGTMLANLDEAVSSLNTILASQSTQQLPVELEATLEELRSVLDGLSQDAEIYQDLSSSLSSLDRTLESLNRLARELADRPSSVLFPPPPREDPVPEAGQ